MAISKIRSRREDKELKIKVIPLKHDFENPDEFDKIWGGNSTFFGEFRLGSRIFGHISLFIHKYVTDRFKLVSFQKFSSRNRVVLFQESRIKGSQDQLLMICEEYSIVQTS